MVARCLYIVAVCVLSVSLMGGAQAEALRLGISPKVFEAIRERLALSAEAPVMLRRENCPDLLSDDVKNAGRAVIEILIVCHAVFEADLADEIEVVNHLPHKRRLSEIAAGRIDVSGNTVFPEVLATLPGQTVPLLSQDVIRVNEFEKGIFTTPERTDVLAVRSLDDLRKFRAVIVKFWAVDVKTLDAMDLQQVIKISKQDAYLDFLEGRRADFTISEFASATTWPWAKGLVRVPGVKVSLVSPRQFPVSPERPDIQKAIGAFIKRSRSAEPDLIVRAFQHSGFFQTEFSDWKLLFPIN